MNPKKAAKWDSIVQALIDIQNKKEKPEAVMVVILD